MVQQENGVQKQVIAYAYSKSIKKWAFYADA